MLLQAVFNPLSISFGAVTLLALLTLFLPPTVFAARDELEPVTLQLRWHHQFQFAGYYAAKAQGYYRDIGLDVTIVNGQPGREPVNEVLSGTAVFGVANGELLHQRLKGQPLVALAAIFQHSASVLVAKQSSGIRTPHDLIGRKVMLVSTGADVGLVAMLHNEGVDISRINVVKSSYDINDLIRDEVDAFNSYITNEPFYLSQQGIPFTVIHPATYGVDFYSDILFTHENRLQQDPEQVRVFRQASLRGWEYAMAHPDEVIELIINEYGSSKSREHLRFEAEQMRGLILPKLIEIGHMNPGRWQHMADTFVAQGMADPGVDLSGFVYDPSLDANDVWRQVAILFGSGFGVIIGVVILLVFYTRKLRSAISYGRMVQAKLRNQTALFESIFRSTPDATLITDSDHRIIMCNPAFGQIFGYRPEEVAGQTTELIYDRQEQYEEQKQLRFHPQAKMRLLPFEIAYRRKNGDLFPGHSMGGPIIDRYGEGLGYIMVIRDITEQKRSEEAVVRMALTDSLTGLANRHQFNQRIEQLLKRAKRAEIRFALLLMDLDHFKKVNDCYGHPLGDELLRRVGLILRGVFREVDVIARIGGDEFAIVMVDQADPMLVRQAAERLIGQLARPLVIDGHSIQIGASVGVALYPQDSEEATALYRFADKALYHSKQHGRNACTFVRETQALLQPEEPL